MLGQMLSGLTQVWLDVALVLSFVGIAIFKGERLSSPGMFLVACMLFAASVVLPALEPIVTSPATIGQGPRELLESDTLPASRTSTWFTLVRMGLFADSFLVAMFSLSFDDMR